MKQKYSGFSLIELSIVILIIGILIAGVTQGSRLVRESRLKTARTITESSDVNSIKDVILWLDAANEDTIATGTLASNEYGNAEQDDAVVGWKDRNVQLSGDIVLAPHQDASAPKYQKSGINGLPSIRFTSDNLGYDDFQFFVENYSIFAVIRPLSAGTQYIVNVSTIDTTSLHGLVFSLESSGFIRFLHRSPYSVNSTSGNFYSTNSWQANKPYITSLVRDINASSAEVWLNNQQYISETATRPRYEPDSLKLVIGAIYFGGTSYSRYFDGDISEVIIFDRALKNSERIDIQKYLSKKYNIALS